MELKDKEPLILLIAALAALAISGINPYDRMTWWLEVFPVIIGIPVLIATGRSFPLTNLLDDNVQDIVYSKNGHDIVYS